MRAPLQAPNTASRRTLLGHPTPACISCCQHHAFRLRSSDAAVARALPAHTDQRTADHNGDACDLVLSSGFLAFAGHTGFLQAVEELGLPVGGVMGTSAGALVGSLYCAGYSPQQVAQHLSEQAPASLLRPSGAPWRGGALSLDGVISRLKDLLPPTFEDLEREFAVGVVTADGQHLLIDSGPLPEAVAASAAIPFVFQAVDVPGRLSRHGPFKDGGVVDRVGLKAWRERRRLQLQKSPNGSPTTRKPPPCLVHVIDRSSPFSGFDDTSAMGESHIVVVKSPRSGANFFDLGAFKDHMEAAKQRARPHLAAIRRNSSSRRSSNNGGGSGGGSNGAVGPVNGNGHSANGNGKVTEDQVAVAAATVAAATTSAEQIARAKLV